MLKKPGPCQKNTGWNDNQIIADVSFENALKFKCLRITRRNQNNIHGGIENRLNIESACYCLVQNLCLSVSLMECKIKLYKTVCNITSFFFLCVGMKFGLTMSLSL